MKNIIIGSFFIWLLWGINIANSHPCDDYQVYVVNSSGRDLDLEYHLDPNQDSKMELNSDMTTPHLLGTASVTGFGQPTRANLEALDPYIGITSGTISITKQYCGVYMAQFYKGEWEQSLGGNVQGKGGATNCKAAYSCHGYLRKIICDYVCKDTSSTSSYTVTFK